MPPIRVCFVLLRAYAVFRPEMKARFGGAEVQVYLLARELAKDPAFDVTVVSRDFGQPEEEWIEGVRQRKISQGRPFVRGLGAIGKMRSAAGLLSTLKSVDADIYVQRCAAVETGLVAHACRRAAKPFLHCVACDPDVDGRFEKETAFWIRTAYRYGLRNASQIVCQNAYQLQALAERFGKKGLSIPSACEATQRAAAHGRDSILWVSRAIPRKRPELLLELAAALPNEHFVAVLPSGPDKSLQQDILQRSKTLANIEVLSHVPYRDIASLFARAKIFVCTSEYEGFPNTYLQAMQHAVPIASMCVDPNGVLSREGAGATGAGDFQKFQAHVVRFLTDGDAHATAARAGLGYVRRNHDVAAVAERYKALFRDLVG